MASDKTTLGDRMKRHEQTTRSFLLRRTPVIIRLDGRAFHTFTKQQFFKTTDEHPFNTVLHDAMMSVATVCTHFIQNCVLAYTQSDEVSLLLVDWNENETQQWFDGNVQKMASISASTATIAFNNALKAQGYDFNGVQSYGQFDSRVFNLPREEVCNYFIWRQQDASRNSVQMLGHHHFSQKQMHGLNNSQVQDKLMLEKNINWNNLETWMKRGSCVLRAKSPFDSSVGGLADEEIPIFTAQRNYIDAWMDTESHRSFKEAVDNAFPNMPGLHDSMIQYREKHGQSTDE